MWKHHTYFRDETCKSHETQGGKTWNSQGRMKFMKRSRGKKWVFTKLKELGQKARKSRKENVEFMKFSKENVNLMKFSVNFMKFSGENVNFMKFTKEKREIHEIQQRKREFHAIHEEEAWNSWNSAEKTWNSWNSRTRSVTFMTFMKFSRENVKFMKFTKKKRETHVIQQTMKREAWNPRKRRREIHEIAHYSWVQKIRGEKRKKKRNTRNVKFREKDNINHLCKLLNVKFREIHVSRSQRCFAKYLDSFSAGNLRLGGRHAECMYKQRLLFIPNAAKTCANFMPATYKTESLGDMTPLYSTSASWTALRQRSCHRNLIREEL